MELGLCVDPRRPWPDIVRLALAAEAASWRTVYVCDHFMSYSDDGSATTGSFFEGWTMLSALAPITRDIALGTLVLSNSYRHPAVVANMASTLDTISGGRLVLGLGAGWQANEHAAYGLPLLPPGQRLDALEEACIIVQGLWTHERFSFRGAHYAITDATCDPKPLQQPLPLLIGGSGEKRTLRIAAHYADRWHTWASPEQFAHKNRVLDAHCVDVGRDMSTIERLCGGGYEPWHGRSDDSADLRGSEADVLATLTDFAGAGADEYIVRDIDTNTIDDALRHIDVLTALAAKIEQV